MTETISYCEKLYRSAADARSIYCLGIDPMLELFPEELRPTGTIGDIGGINTLVHTALEALEEASLRPAAFKPNIGYFAACDRPMEFDLPLEERFAGSLALSEVIRTLRERMPEVPLILDSKRGDIARSSDNYAREAFYGWRADALTVSPWMGDDSVEPFLIGSDNEFAAAGVYLLVRTSNPGAARFQNLPTPNIPLYRRVLEATREWSPGTGLCDTTQKRLPGTTTRVKGAVIGAVVGATAPAELREIAWSLRDFPIPLLIPGVGRQGGTAKDVLRVLTETDYPLELVRVNISSGSLFPWSTGRSNAKPYNWRQAVRASVLNAHAGLAFPVNNPATLRGHREHGESQT